MTEVEGEKPDEAPKNRGRRAKAEGDENARSKVRAAKIGRALWRAENSETLKGVSAEDRKARWAEVKKDYTTRSRQLLKALRKEGFELAESEAPAGARKGGGRRKAAETGEAANNA